MARKLKDLLFKNTAFYLLLGIVLAVFIARAYVYFGGNLGLGYDGISFHHIFLGIILVIVSGFVFFAFNDRLAKNKMVMNVMAVIFGFGAGLITDEANFLISVGHYYNLSNYYQPINGYVDTVFIAIVVLLLVFSLFSRKSK